MPHLEGPSYASLAVTNVMGSSLTRMVDSTLYTRAGPEVAVASTKTFVSQLVALYILAFQLAPNRNAVETIPNLLRALFFMGSIPGVLLGATPATGKCTIPA